MTRPNLSAAMIALMGLSLPVAAAHAQASVAANPGGVASVVSGYLFWLFIALAIFFLVMSAFAYAMVYKGAEMVKKTYYRILYAVISIVLAVLVKLFEYMVVS